jgi:hypothetical protein
MGHSVDQMAQEVITAREVNVRGKAAPIGPTAGRADAGGQTASQGQFLAEVSRSPAENTAK